jgi:hypothetical protein
MGSAIGPSPIVAKCRRETRAGAALARASHSQAQIVATRDSPGDAQNLGWGSRSDQDWYGAADIASPFPRTSNTEFLECIRNLLLRGYPTARIVRAYIFRNVVQ